MTVNENETGTVSRQESQQYRRGRITVSELTRPAVGLAGVVLFQLLFASRVRRRGDRLDDQRAQSPQQGVCLLTLTLVSLDISPI